MPCKGGASKSNEHHVAEIGSARESAKEDVSKNSEDIIKHMEVTSQEEQEVVRGILDTIKAQAMMVETLQEDRSTQSGAIDQKACDTFQHKYMDCEPSGKTPGEFTQPFLKPPHLERNIFTLLISESTMVFGRTLISDNDGNYKGRLTLPLKEGNSMVIVGQAICPVQPWYS
ncbi:Kinesin, motor domain-containing protein [Artemisia annua]|uniref:Kinesin, motor domain-containing protein n=1 Tax=Artemisia annua TaxID=35608 RepID=A0A2U1LHB5_ARTAN|nr:Kinesin, motor domain-containing protein [Artemisia annua]